MVLVADDCDDKDICSSMMIDGDVCDDENDGVHRYDD